MGALKTAPALGLSILGHRVCISKIKLTLSPALVLIQSCFFCCCFVFCFLLFLFFFFGWGGRFEANHTSSGNWNAGEQTNLSI